MYHPSCQRTQTRTLVAGPASRSRSRQRFMVKHWRRTETTYLCLLDEKDPNHSQQGDPDMTSIVDSAVKIQTTSESNFSPPSWFGEIVAISRYLRTHRQIQRPVIVYRFEGST